MKNMTAAKKITYFAILLALTTVLQLVGNTVKIGVVTLNFSLIPIVLAAIILGEWFGAALGTVTGLIILLNNGILGADGFTNVLFATDPVVIILVCLLKTGVAGYLSGLLFKIIKKHNPYVAVFVASGIVPVVNSGLFIVGMLFITKSLYAVGFVAEGASAFATIILLFVGLNFVFEFAVNLIVAPALYRVISILDKSFGKKHDKADITADDNVSESSESDTSEKR